MVVVFIVVAVVISAHGAIVRTPGAHTKRDQRTSLAARRVRARTAGTSGSNGGNHNNSSGGGNCSSNDSQFGGGDAVDVDQGHVA